MDIQFDCSCGDRISEFTRGPSPDIQVKCEQCGAIYAVTITQLRDSE